MSVIWQRKSSSTQIDSSGVRIVIPYWIGWGPFSFIAFWNLMNIQMGYQLWQCVSRGIVGPLTRDKLRLSEIFAVLGLSLLFWLAAGREVITLDAAFLGVRKEIFGLGWSRQYLLTRVGEVRAFCFLDPKADGKWSAENVRAAVSFKYQGKARSFCREVSMQDALNIEKTFRSFRPGITTPA